MISEMTNLSFANIEDAAGAPTTAASKAAHLPASEPDIADNEKQRGRKAQKFLLPTQLCCVCDGHCSKTHR